MKGRSVPVTLSGAKGPAPRVVSFASLRMTWILALLFAGGCEFYHYEIPSPDRLWHIIPWFDHMITARYIRPYETADVPRYTPEGAVPVSGGEPDWSADWTSGKVASSDALKNPFAAGAEGRPSPGGPAVEGQ